MSYDPRSAPTPTRTQQDVPTQIVQDTSQSDQIEQLQQQIAELQSAIEALQNQAA